MLRFIAALLLALSFPARAVEYSTVLPERSQITFTSKQMGVPVEGRFKKFNAAVLFDPAKPETGRAQIEVDLGSIDAGHPDADEEVKGKGWFNIKQFPIASFVAEGPGSLRALGNNRFEARGKISIKGRTHDVLVPFSYKPEAAGKETKAVLEGSIPILRSQFALGDGPWADTSVVADEVPIKFRFVLAEKTNTAK